MAGESETLQYLIEIRGGAEGAAEIRKVDDAMGKTAKSTKAVGEESGKAVGKLNSAAGGIRSVGKALFAAGAGFVAWEAGKKSFEFTHEMLLSTKQLTSAFGLSTQEASRWSGVTAAVGGNAGQSAVAFQKLSKAADTQTHATKEAIAAGKIQSAAALEGKGPLEKLGISTAYLEKHQKNLGPVMELLVDRIHKTGDAQTKGAVLSTLFGRGWRQLSPILLEGKEHLEGLMNVAKEMGVELKGDAGKALEEFREKQIRAKLATEGLQLRFTELAAKPMGDLLQGFSSLALAVQHNDWTAFDKQTQKIGETFTHIAQTILPKVAESFGHMAPAVLKGFIHGFGSASLGGQAVIAAVLLTKIGLTKAVLGTLAASSANLFLKPFGVKVQGGVVKSVEKAAVISAGEDAAFAEAGATAGGTFSSAFAAALPVAAAVALGYSAYVVGKTAFGGNAAEPFGGDPYGRSGPAPGEHTLTPHDRTVLAGEKAVAEKKREDEHKAFVKTHPHFQERATREEEEKGWRPKKKGYAPSQPWPILPPARAHGSSTEIRDIHVHVDGRKLFTVNARQALQAEAAGE